MRLTVSLCEPLADEQVSLLGREEYAGQVELDRLIERLRVRLGEEAVVRAELVEAYVPERAWKFGGEETRGQGDKGTRRKKALVPLSPCPPPCLLVSRPSAPSTSSPPPRSCASWSPRRTTGRGGR
jgi:hypothetical protein